MRRVLSVVAALMLFCSSAFSTPQLPRGFDGKVYRASMALYGTLPAGTYEDEGEQVVLEKDVTHFVCTVTAFEKVEGGYLLLGAGHCTSEANPDDLPKGLVYSVSDNIGTELHPVKLLKAEMSKEQDKDYIDYSVWFLKSDKKIPVIPLGDDNEVEVGSKTVDVNFSLGPQLTKQLSKGYVASITAEDPSKMAGMMLVTQFDSHGASGSAIVSEKTHQIIGIVIGGVDGTTTPTIAEPISKIREKIAGVQP